jgi:hypothetical protein
MLSDKEWCAEHEAPPSTAPAHFWQNRRDKGASGQKTYAEAFPERFQETQNA